MAEQNLVLSRKYRPTSLDEIVGNESTVESLRTILDRPSGRPHAFLFQGPSGCGKTTLARILAKHLNPSGEGLTEFNISKLRGIETAKEIIGLCLYKAADGSDKVFILNEIHKSTNEFQNAMLDILEEPPSHIYFILVTTNPEKLLPAVRTRCTVFQVAPLQTAKIINLLKWVCSAKNENVAVGDKVLQKIATSCGGSPRRALVLLDQIIDIPDDDAALQALIDTTLNESSVADLCQKLLLPNVKWETLAAIIKDMNDDPEEIRYAILTWMSKTLLSKDSKRASDIILLLENSWMYMGKAGLVNTCYLISKIK